jgi:hypothetical protein
MPETDEGYALPRGGQAHRLAILMMGHWVSQLRAAFQLHIVEIHPRLPDIRRAGGDYRMRECGIGADKWAEYTLTAVPRVIGTNDSKRAAIVINQPGNEPMDWVPPPPIDRVAA